MSRAGSDHERVDTDRCILQCTTDCGRELHRARSVAVDADRSGLDRNHGAVDRRQLALACS